MKFEQATTNNFIFRLILCDCREAKEFKKYARHDVNLERIIFYCQTLQENLKFFMAV